MTRIGIIIGSTRPGRKADVVAKWVHEHASKRTDATFELVDIADYNLPLLDEPVPPSMNKYSKPHTLRWAEKIATWNNKAAAFVGYGSALGARAIESLRLVMGELQIADVRAHVGLSLFTDFENMQTFKPAALHTKALETMFDQLVRWSRALATVRG